MLSNGIFGFLPIFTGEHISPGEPPESMSAISEILPFTHAIEAARELADGA